LKEGKTSEPIRYRAPAKIPCGLHEIFSLPFKIEGVDLDRGLKEGAGREVLCFSRRRTLFRNEEMALSISHEIERSSTPLSVIVFNFKYEGKVRTL
jgi:hypothetical protein